MTTYATNQSAISRFAALGRAVVTIYSAYKERRARRQARAELLRLNDALLRDIGLTRFDVYAAGSPEAPRPGPRIPQRVPGVIDLPRAVRPALVRTAAEAEAKAA